MMKVLLAWVGGVAALAGAVLASERETLVKMNKERIAMSAFYATLCREPVRDVEQHDSAEVDLYLNGVALDYRMQHPDEFAYPVGSKFVKKKFSEVGVEEPDVATVMIKIANEGTVHDWQFTMHRLPDEVGIDLKGAERCASCHESFKESGYVSGVSEAALQQYFKDQKPTNSAQ